MIRARSSAWGRSLGRLEKGERVVVLEERGSRARVRRGGTSGWVPSDQLAGLTEVEPHDASSEAGTPKPSPAHAGALPSSSARPTPVRAGTWAGDSGVALSMAPSRDLPSSSAELLAIEPRGDGDWVRQAPRVLLLRSDPDLASPPSGSCFAGARLRVSVGDERNGFVRVVDGPAGWVVATVLRNPPRLARR